MLRWFHSNFPLSEGPSWVKSVGWFLHRRGPNANSDRNNQISSSKPDEAPAPVQCVQFSKTADVFGLNPAQFRSMTALTGHVPTNLCCISLWRSPEHSLQLDAWKIRSRNSTPDVGACSGTGESRRVGRINQVLQTSRIVVNRARSEEWILPGGEWIRLALGLA